MKFKFLFILISFLLLSSCGGGSSTVLTEGLKTYEGNNFEIGVPINWTILKEGEGGFPRASVGEVVLAANSEKLMHGFANNILILKQDLNKETTSQNFSQLNNVGAQRNYLEYTNFNTKNIIFSDFDESSIYIFEAKYNISTPKLKFLQVGKVCNYKTGYLITIAISTDVRDTSIYEELIKTFKCK